MYTLDLTPDELAAFQWVGHRYNAGPVMKLLEQCEVVPAETRPPAIRYSVPEHVAWRICELRDEEHGSWPCFDAYLRQKLNRFCDGVV
jgi:hypothetical protein